MAQPENLVGQRTGAGLGVAQYPHLPVEPKGLVPVDEVLEIAFADSHATPKTVSPQFSGLDPSPDGLGADFQPVRDGRDRRQCQSKSA